MAYSILMIILTVIYCKTLIRGGCTPRKWEYWACVVCYTVATLISMLEGASI